MSSSMHSIQRVGLFALLALQGAAIDLVARDGAAAPTWHYTVVDGNGSLGFGNAGYTTTEQVRGATSAILFGTWAVPLYTRQDPTNGWNIYMGADAAYDAACNGQDGYSIGVVDTRTDLNGPAALQDSGNTWLAYTDANDDLFASVSGYGPSAGSRLVNGSSRPLALHTPSIAVMDPGSGEGAFVFYTADTASFSEEIHYFTYDTTTSSWSGDKVLDTSGGALMDPAAVSFNGGIWVFYWDAANNCLKGKASNSDGGWTTLYVEDECIDGKGYGFGFDGGQVTDPVGQHPAAFVDTTVTPNRLYVYYTDYGAHPALRYSYIDAGDPVYAWASGVVDGDVVINYPAAGSGPMIAPLLDRTGSPQVYYIDSVNQVLKHTTLNLSTMVWGSPITTDGSGTSYAGHTNDHLDGPLSAVMRSECSGDSVDVGPHVYYTDVATHALHEAFIQ